MKILADLKEGKLIVDSEEFGEYGISCKVRSLANGDRMRSQIVRSIPDDLPYDPRPFPKGLWKITAVEWRKDKGFDEDVYGQVKIRTDAFQVVNAWQLDEDGDYLMETTRQIRDSGYLLHWSASNTTLGCIRIDTPEIAVQIGKTIEAAFNAGETVQLEVI
jgi:hypothetical protein